ncbi:MAG: hypothetical protein ACD_24C00151G0005 [uncultured bacterium]|nr:MAG: hypothetical protein ACD_24C00151G0005 [uncultured bacterium]
MRKNKGFTLLEMILVLGILAFIIAFIIPEFTGTRESIRDTARKSDLKQIQKALELYRQSSFPPLYPVDNTFLLTPGSCWSSGAGCAGNIYMKKVPGDPIKTPQAYYFYTPMAGDLRYTLCACLEKSVDPDSVGGNCPGVTCSSGIKYELTEP